MVARTSPNVYLSPELLGVIEARIASGRYQSASEVVQDALLLLEKNDVARQDALSEVRDKISTGLEQANRGDLLDGEEVFRDLESQIRGS